MELLPKSEAECRARRFQAWMQSAGVDICIVVQNADLYYFSGTVQVGLLCLPAAGDPLFLVQKSAARARAESPLERILPLGGLKKAPGILAAEGFGAPRRIGLELDVLPVSFFERIRELFPAAEFTDASEAVRRLRMIKSDFEIDQIRKAAAQLRLAFARVPEWLRPGATELEVLSRVEGYLREVGHQGLTRMRGFNYEIAYGTISGGPNACHPTFFPGPVGFTGLYAAVPNGGSRRRFERGETVVADIVGGHAGYIADKTRIFSIGPAADEMHRAQDFVLELLREVEGMLAPGIPCERIWQHASHRIEESPYAPGFMGVGDSQVRFVGHGVGLELDELPVLADRFDLPLAPGMTIAVEPKIFFAGRGGVGVENTYAITETGCEKLTLFEERIIEVG